MFAPGRDYGLLIIIAGIPMVPLVGPGWAVIFVGLFLWIIIIYRAIRSRLRSESKFNMPWLFFYAGLAIPGFYAVGLFATN